MCDMITVVGNAGMVEKLANCDRLTIVMMSLLGSDLAQ